MPHEIISPEGEDTVSGTQLPMDGTTHAQFWRVAFILAGKVRNWEISAGVAEGTWFDLFCLHRASLLLFYYYF